MPKSPPNLAALIGAQNLLRGAQNPWAALSVARARVSASNLQAFVRWLPNVRGKSGPLTRHRFPKRRDQIWFERPLEPVPLSREVAWAVAQIYEEAPRIRRFLELKSAYEVALCSGASIDCFEVLDLIERELGYSFWVVEARIAALQFLEGLEAQKKYVADLHEILPGNDVVSFFAYYISRRVEPSTPPMSFVRHFAEVTGKWGPNEGLAPYLNFRVAGIPPQSADDYATILRHETPCSVIDQYETLCCEPRLSSS